MGELPWPAGAATGIGSLPGTDIVEALKTAFGEAPDLPFVPELPARGPGADLLGQGAGRLVSMPVELYAGRWRMTARPGRDARRTADLAARDLDALTAQAVGYQGPLKVQVAGPWTLAAGLELRSGGPVLRDPGAVRDLVASLAEGLRRHVGEVAARVPGARLLLQLDEPSLPAVLAGRVPTASGLGTLGPVEEASAGPVLRSVIEAAGVPVVVHCCAADPPLPLLHGAGAVAVAVDLDLVAGATGAAGATDLDVYGEALDAGLGLLAGAVPTGPSGPSGPDEPPGAAVVADRLRDWWRRLGLAEERLPVQVVVTQACGLAGATPEHARAALVTAWQAARRLNQ